MFLSSFSLACQSWRCGFVVTHPSVAVKLMRVHDPIYISVPWLQHAIAQYLTENYDDFATHVKQLGILMQNNWILLSKVLQQSKKIGLISN
jgi:aspartate/methionine/tyrosine aminotransferase